MYRDDKYKCDLKGVISCHEYNIDHMRNEIEILTQKLEALEKYLGLIYGTTEDEELEKAYIKPFND